MFNLKKFCQKSLRTLLKNKKLEHALDDLTDAYARPGTEDYPWATMPILFTDMIRGRLEQEVQKWKGTALLSWGALFLLSLFLFVRIVAI